MQRDTNGTKILFSIPSKFEYSRLQLWRPLSAIMGQEMWSEGWTVAFPEKLSRISCSDKRQRHLEKGRFYKIFTWNNIWKIILQMELIQYIQPTDRHCSTNNGNFNTMDWFRLSTYTVWIWNAAWKLLITCTTFHLHLNLHVAYTLAYLLHLYSWHMFAPMCF